MVVDDSRVVDIWNDDQKKSSCAYKENFIALPKLIDSRLLLFFGHFVSLVALFKLLLFFGVYTKSKLIYFNSLIYSINFKIANKIMDVHRIICMTSLALNCAASSLPVAAISNLSDEIRNDEKTAQRGYSEKVAPYATESQFR